MLSAYSEGIRSARDMKMGKKVRIKIYIFFQSEVRNVRNNFPKGLVKIHSRFRVIGAYTPLKLAIVSCSLEYRMNFVTLRSSEFKNKRAGAGEGGLAPTGGGGLTPTHN